MATVPGLPQRLMELALVLIKPRAFYGVPNQHVVFIIALVCHESNVSVLKVQYQEIFIPHITNHLTLPLVSFLIMFH